MQSALSPHNLDKKWREGYSGQHGIVGGEQFQTNVMTRSMRAP